MKHLSWMFAFGSALSAVAAQPVVIDERFDEWTEADLVASDPAGDSRVDGFDLARVWARTDGTTLYVSFEFHGTRRTLQAGEIDGMPQLSVVLPSGDELTVFHRLRKAVLSSSGVETFAALTSDDAVESWDDLDYCLLPTVASNRYEMRLDLAAVGARIGDQIELRFDSPAAGRLISAGDSEAISTLMPPDTLDMPIRLLLSESTDRHTRQSITRPGDSELRVAVFNVLRGQVIEEDTPSHDDAHDRLSRLLDGVDADIYLLQEQHGRPEQLEERFNKLDPLENGARWNAHTDSSDTPFGSDFIVTHLPVKPVIDPLSERFAAAVVGDDPETAVLVLSIHPKCCGYAGSREDAMRIEEAAQTVQLLQRFRLGRLGEELARFADVPVIVAGDWNLVGSNGPREILTAPGVGLEHLVLLTVDGRDAATWRSLRGYGFSPGVLDLLTYSPLSLDALGGFVVETERMTAGELRTLGVRREDSRVSDHRLLIADFRRRK